MRVVPAAAWHALTGAVARNRLMAVALVPAALLRADAELGYRWQIWFNDSFNYVSYGMRMVTDPTRVSGYSVFLRVLEPFHSFALVTILQHLMGLSIGVMVYAVARHRFGVPAPFAVLATLPVLYDGFQIQLEQMIMSDALFEFLLILAVTLLLWRRKPSWQTCTAAGLLLGLSALVRTISLPLLAVFIVYLIARKVNWRALVAVAAACVAPVLGYAGWYDMQHGQFGTSSSTGIFLYSRTMTFADCAKINPPASLRPLCTNVPPGKRPNAETYIWSPESPLSKIGGHKFSPHTNKLARSFAIRAIEAQPLDYARAVLADTWRAFGWDRKAFPDAATYNEYLFGYRSLAIPAFDLQPVNGYSSYEAAYLRGDPLTDVVNPFAAVIRGYQRYVWLPGTVYGLILLIGLGGMAVGWRRFGGRALLPWATSLALIVVPAVTAEFSYRYVLPAVPLACLAAAVAFAPQEAGGRWLAGLRRGVATGKPGGGPDGPAAGTGDDERDLAADTA